MKRLTKLTLLSALALSLAVFSACNKDDAENTETNSLSTAHSSEIELAADMEMDVMEMEIPNPLSEEEAAKFQASLDLNERIELAEELSMMMPKDGMDQMKIMFTDLEKVATIEDEDPRNMMKMGAESMWYSQEADITIQACNMANSPMHIYSGNDPSIEEIEEAMEMMHEMMEMDMDEDHDIMDTEEDDSEELVTDYKSEKAAYLAYSEDTYNSLLGSKPIVLFFHADWCPTCLWVEENVKAELSSFPDGTKILQANFDTEQELKKKYNILIQSTLVVLDKEGKVTTRLAVPDNKELIAAIQGSL